MQTNLRVARKNFRSIEQSIEEFLINDQHKQDKRKEESEIITQPTKTLTPERNMTSSPLTESTKKDIGETQPDKRYHGNGRFPQFFVITTKQRRHIKQFCFCMNKNQAYEFINLCCRSLSV